MDKVASPRNAPLIASCIFNVFTRLSVRWQKQAGRPTCLFKPWRVKGHHPGAHKRCIKLHKSTFVD